MKIAIIDDLLECRKEIQSCIQCFFSKYYVEESLLVKEFNSGDDFISTFKKDTYDLIFIDQYMQGLSGIDTAKKIRQSDELVTLVFITTSSDYAIDSYRVRASGYLLKPFSYDDFEQTLYLIGMTKLKNARFIYVQDEKILLREILWCDLEGHYIQIHTLQYGILRYRIPFSTIADKLLNYSQFLTCYKKCIVNLDHVEKIDKEDFLLSTGKRIFFSKRDKKKIENSYHTYLFQKAREDELL